VLKEERSDCQQKKGSEQSPTEAPRCYQADQQADGNRVNFKKCCDRNAQRRAVPAFNVNGGDRQQ
jgi:hypothetical protein